MHTLTSSQFVGTDRFRVRSCLGEGAHGIVYEVLDLRSQTRMALKVLRRAEPRRLLGFKREFRALVEIDHPNLVRLGELFEKDGSWFFTMELVEGINLLDYVRGSDETRTLTLAGGCFSPDEQRRLSAALLQLADALDRIHRAGLLHRDVKPSNIRITPADRLVLLDFGLVSPHSEDELASIAERVVGTVAYMAPEQAAGEALTPAADFYAVGVLLYEALTGRLPFSGSPVEVLSAKQSRDAPDPADVTEGLPSNLVDLCRDLLSRDPPKRPHAAALRSRLNGRASPPRDRILEKDRGRPPPALFGRESELAVLEQALARAGTGQLVAVKLEGESGVGKTTLVQAFGDRLEGERGDCTVLAGSCHAQEKIPYNAFDAAIDALSRKLAGLSAETCARLLPRHASLLAVLFPTLARVSAVALAPRSAVALDPITIRDYAFRALRELLHRMCEHGQVVLLLEDLHWADAESVELLRALVREPDPPPLLLIVTSWRRQECGTDQYQNLNSVLVDVNATFLELGRLPTAAALALTTHLIQATGVSSPECASRIVRETDGHPLFIERLVRSAAAGVLQDESVEGALSNEIAHLTAPARRILHLLAIAGADVAHMTLARASGLEPDEFDSALALLIRNKLARVQRSGSEPTIGLYHVRVRSPAVARLEAGYIRQCHLDLASVLEADKTEEFEALAVHWAEAGELERAASYFRQAAEVAAQALAFHHAAKLYQRALELAPRHEQRELRVKLGHALAHAGRSADAGEAFLAAAMAAPGRQALELRRLGAHYLLRCGRVNRGLEVARELLQSLNIPLPRTRSAMVASVLWQRLRLHARGLRFEERLLSGDDEEEALVCNVLWSIASAIAYVDAIVGADLHTRALRRVLDLGDPQRIARSLALEGMYGMDGDSVKARGVIATAESLARRLDDPFAEAYVKLAWGVSHVHEGDARRGLLAADQAALLFEQNCRDVAWEIGFARIVGLAAALFLGQFRGIETRFQVALRAAEERGDLFGITTLFGLYRAHTQMAADRADECEEELHAVIARWPVADSLQHRMALISHVLLDLYRGGGAAHERIEKAWPGHKRSFLLRYQRLRIVSLESRGAAALAALVAGSCKRSTALKLVEECAKQLAGEAVPDAIGSAHLLRAQAWRVLGERSRAAQEYRTAIRHYDTFGVFFARIARQRLAEVVGGDEGAAIVRDNEDWVKQEGIRRPERFFAAIAPVAE